MPFKAVHTSPGVWFTLSGTGETLVLAVTADYDSQISLFAGDSCDSLTCVSTNDDLFQDLGLGIFFDSGLVETLEDGQTYYVLVGEYIVSLPKSVLE